MPQKSSFTPKLFILLLGALFTLAGAQIFLFWIKPAKIYCSLETEQKYCSVSRQAFLFKQKEELAFNPQKAVISSSEDSEGVKVFTLNILDGKAQKIPLETASNTAKKHRRQTREFINAKLSAGQNFGFNYKTSWVLLPFGVTFFSVGALLLLAIISGLFSRVMPLVLAEPDSNLLYLYPFFGSKKYKDVRKFSDIKYAFIENDFSKTSVEYADYIRLLAAINKKKPPFGLNIIAAPPPENSERYGKVKSVVINFIDGSKAVVITESEEEALAILNSLKNQ